MPDGIARWPIDKLIPFARNPRTHSDEQVAEIAASILEFGFNNPILAESSGNIIAEHGRLLARGSSNSMRSPSSRATAQIPPLNHYRSKVTSWKRRRAWNLGGGSVQGGLLARAVASAHVGEPDAPEQAPEPVGLWRRRRSAGTVLRLQLVQIAEEELLPLLAVVFEFDHHGQPLTTGGRHGHPRPS